MFSKIDQTQTRLAESVYEQVFDAIVRGTIPPGTRLIQESLAADLAVSRTPVREALLRLEQEGILEFVQRRGFFVRDISEDDINDLYEARIAIEGFAARAVAEAQDAAALGKLERMVRSHAESEPVSVTEAFRANEAVHREVVRATGNPVLVELFDSVWTRSIGLRMYAHAFSSDAHIQHVVDEHVPLLDALLAGDAARAEKEMIAHIQAGRDVQLAARGSRS
ncbi:MAG: GntR family transcriptional regulator [Acidimicrobiia bacterium]